MLVMILVLAAVLFVVLPLVFGAVVMLMAVLSGAAVLAWAGLHAGEGVLAGIVLGYLLYRTIRKSRTAPKAETRNG